MIEIKKEDVKILDFILEKISQENTFLTCDDLSKFGTGNPLIFSETEFERIMFILNEYNVCKCNFTADANSIYATPKTPYFIKEGGFKKVYSDIEKRNYNEKIELRKKEIDLEIAEKILKEYPYTKFIAWAGLVIAIISGFLQLL